MHKLIVMLAACSFLAGCQSSLMSKDASLQGKFIDSPKAKPLALQPVTNNPLINNKVVDLFAGNHEKDETRGFGRVNQAEQMARVNGFNSPELQAYCDQVLSKLLAQWPHEKPTIQIRFSASESFGAYATADNIIYLNLGTFQAIESEDELASILGHEASHLLLGHLDREHFFNQQKKLLDASVNAVSLAATVSNLESQKIGDSRKLILGNTEKVGETILQSAVSGMALKAVTDNFWNSSWTRAQEDEADLLSVDLLSRAGYSPRGAVHSIQRLSSFEGVQESQFKQFREQQSQLFSQSVAKKDVGGIVGQAVSSSLAGAQIAVTSLWQDFGKRHHATELRETGLSRYIGAEYRHERRRKLQLASYQKNLLEGEIGKTLAAHIMINNANKALASGNNGEAEKIANEVYKSSARNSLRAQTLNFLLMVNSGQHSQALAGLDRVQASEWQYASVSNYDQIVSLALSVKKTDQAERYLRYGQQYWGDEQMAPLEVQVHLQRANIEQAQKVYSKCQKSPSKALLAQCDRAIGQYKPKAEKAVNPLESLGLPSMGKLIGS